MLDATCAAVTVSVMIAAFDTFAQSAMAVWRQKKISRIDGLVIYRVTGSKGETKARIDLDFYYVHFLHP